jgi:hypothetical protein
MSDDILRMIQKQSENIDSHKQLVEKVEESFSDLDTTINFKVNSLLKAKFETLCKNSHSNTSRELKLFMLKSIKNGRL